jgi:hypothetical protein
MYKLILFISLLLYYNLQAEADSTCLRFVNLAQEMSFRPVHPDKIYTEHFIIHYNSSETSFSYANNVATYSEIAYEKICIDKDWPIPPPDDGRGGDDRYDIYLMADGDPGECVAEYNPSWPYEYAPSYIKLRNNIPDGLNTGDLRVTVAHEFNHATQLSFTYKDGYPQNFWFYENCATYISDAIFNFTYYYFANFWGVDPLNYPEWKIDSQGDDTGFYKYAGFIWPMFLIEWTNDDDVIRKIWQRMGQVPGENIFSDIDFVLKNPQYEKSLDEALVEYAVWRYFTGSRADQNSLKHLFPESKVKSESTYPTGNKFFDQMGGLGGANFIVFTGNNDVLNISMNGADSILWETMYLRDNGYNNFSKHIFPLNYNGDGSLEIIKRDVNNIVLIPVCFTPSRYSGTGYYSGTALSKRVVKFTNKYSQEILGGQLLLNNSDDINSGDFRILSYNTYSVKTKNERFPGSIIRKHNNWNSQSQLYFLNRNFPVTSEGDVDQNAHFNNLNLATVHNIIDGMSFNDGVPIWFNDPWYVKDEYSTQSGMGDFLPFPSPYYPTGKYSESTGGVFLDQGWPDWTPPYYSVKAESVLDTSLTNTGSPAGRSHRFYFRNWSADSINGQPSAQFQYPNSLTTPVVFKSENATVQANLKGTQLSNNVNAYNNNSQRKSVRTPNGQLANIYESLGTIWMENSTDNGQSWFILNNANPLETEPSVNPAIDYFPWGGTHSYIAGVYYLTNNGTLKLKVLRTNNTLEYSNLLPWDPGEGYPVVPSVAVSSDRILVVSTGGINGQNGLVYFYGTVQQSPFNITWTQYNLILPGTGQYSSNPTITANKSAGNIFHIAWQEGSSIKYCTATDSDNNLTFEPVETPSTLSGYQKHLNPSISLVNGYPILSWTGVQYAGLEKVLIKDNDGTTGYQRALIRRKGPQGWGDTQVVGGNQVNFTNNNSVTAAQDKTVIVWSEGATNPQSKWIKRTGSVYSIPANLSHSGIQTQVINGSDYQLMTSIVFNNNQQPYYFIKTTTDFNEERSGGGELGKVQIESDSSVTFGRTGIVSINGVEFIFNTGDVVVDNSVIGFIEKPDTIEYHSYSDLNQYTRTENFQLNGSSQFYFSNLYYVLNKELADTSLGETQSVNFKVELVNANTNQSAGTFDNITYNKYNLEKYDNISYQVNCSGIEQGEYYLRLITTVSTEAEYSLANQ